MEPEPHANLASADALPAIEPDVEESAPAWVALARGVMFFLGFFALLSLLAELRQPAAYSDLWWLDLRCPTPVARAGLALAAALLLAFAVRPTLPDALRRAAVALTLALLGLAIWRTLGFYSAVRAGGLRTELALPFSLHLAACLTVALAGLRAPAAADRLERGGRWLFAIGFLIGAFTFPLAQIHCLGRTDYRRPAGAVLMQIEADEGSSRACLRTACDLLRDGLADELLLTAIEDEAEPAEALRRRAIAEGIPAEQIRILEGQAIAEQNSGIEGPRPILAVGHFYELPRLRLLWSRTGREVCTIPVPQARSASDVAWQVAREVGALWSCYLRPFAS